MHAWGPQSIDELKLRIKQFNNGLRAGQQQHMRGKWINSGKYFAYDRSTRLFGMNKFVGYSKMGLGDQVLHHPDLDDYARVASPPGDPSRSTSTINGTEARKYIADNLGLSYTTFVDLDGQDQVAVLGDFVKWYVAYFTNSPMRTADAEARATKKCRGSLFLLLD